VGRGWGRGCSSVGRGFLFLSLSSFFCWFNEIKEFEESDDNPESP
jgi:hypothetical protein